MSKSKRIENFVLGLLIVLAGLILIISPLDGYKIIDAAFAIIFTVLGIRNLVFYFSLARYMTGGLMALFRGFIFVDLGLFAFSIINMEKSSVMLFIMLGLIVAGIIDIVKALGLRKISSPLWHFSIVDGIICTILPLFSGYLFMAIIIRGALLMFTAFRRSAIVYVNE